MVQSYAVVYRAVWGHLGLYGIIWGPSSWAIWGHLGLYLEITGAIWGYLGPSGVIWGSFLESGQCMSKDGVPTELV